MPFEPGHKINLGRTPWNKGKKLSEKHKRKIRKSLKGRKAWNKNKKLKFRHKLALGKALRGRKLTWYEGKPKPEETKKKMKETYWNNFNKELKEKIKQWQKAKSNS